MDNVPASVPASARSETVSARPASFPTNDLDFVTPWADRPVVVDISDEPTALTPDWVTELARLEAEITEMRAEIATLREETADQR